MPSRTIYGALNGNGAFSSNDPNGAFFNGVRKFSTIAPVVTVTSAQNTLPPLGSPVTCTFASTQPGFWELATNLYEDATLTELSDGLSCSITFTPSTTHAARSRYVGARCVNAAGRSVAVCVVHPGMEAIYAVGPDREYPHLTAAFAAAKASASPGGNVFLLQPGTYTNDDMMMTLDGFGGTQIHFPPSGDYTVDTSGANAVYTPIRFSSIVSETPFGVVLDGLGTRERCVGFQGGTTLEVDEIARWSNGGCIFAVDLRCIHFLGLVLKNTTGECMNLVHVNHIHVEYCLGFNSGIETQPLRAANSYDILFENCFSFGHGRYRIGGYQCKRVIERNCITRRDTVRSSVDATPQGQVVNYRMRQCRVQQILDFDGDQRRFWRTSYQNAGVITTAGTQDWTYNADHYHRNILAYNTHMAGLINDSHQGDTSPTDTFYYDDIGFWRTAPESSVGASPSASYDGPSHINRFTLAFSDNSDNTYCIWNFRKVENITNSIYHRYGYDAAGNPTGSGYFVYSESNATPVNISNTTIFEMGAGAERLGSDVLTSITMTNVDKTTNPFTQGMRYPGRIEPDSNYAAIQRGQDNYWRHQYGRSGTFFSLDGSNGDNDLLVRNWSALTLYDLALVHFRAFSYTGAVREGGTDTMLGDRDGAQADKLLIDYVISDNGRDVPFPASVKIEKVGQALRLSWRPFASAYMSNIAAWRVYLDGALAEEVDPDDHAVDLQGLIEGRNYKYWLTAVDSVHGESGRSYIYEAAA